MLSYRNHFPLLYFFFIFQWLSMYLISMAFDRYFYFSKHMFITLFSNLNILWMELHIVCRKCIYKKLQDEEKDCCPICNIDLGCVPVEKLRSDHTTALFTSSFSFLNMKMHIIVLNENADALRFFNFSPATVSHWTKKMKEISGICSSCFFFFFKFVLIILGKCWNSSGGLSYFSSSSPQ